MGGGRLLIGITREHTIVSDPIDHFCFTGPMLSANGAAVARYIERQDVWRGMVRPLWWKVMRIVSAEPVTAFNGEWLILLNPWEAGQGRGIPEYSPGGHDLGS
jgi:hypothetical protein